MSRSAMNTAAVAQRLRQRRLELGMSTRQLAKLVGTTGVTIGALERDRNIDGQPLALLSRLADTLAIPLDQLLRTGDRVDARDSDSMDPVLVGARLQRQAQPATRDAVARELGWPLGRLDAALDELDRRLEGTGLTLHRAGARVQLAPAADTQPDATCTWTGNRRDTWTTLHVQLVRHVANGSLTPARQQTNGQRVALAELVNAGVLTPTTPAALSAAATYSLVVGDDRESSRAGSSRPTTTAADAPEGARGGRRETRACRRADKRGG